MTANDNETEVPKQTGPLAWFAKNSVAANVIMLVILAGGIVVGSNVKQEVFPEVDLDAVIISVAYPGSTPEEVEKGILFSTEEAVRGLDGVKKVSGVANEGYGTVVVEVDSGADPQTVLQDVKSAVDRITSYPESIERPQVTLATNRQRQVSIVLYGDQDEKSLRALAERSRDELLADDRITQVEVAGVRAPEISIEVSPENLRRYQITLDQIADRIRAASVEVPGGVVRTPGGEILLRTSERRDEGYEFEDVVLVSRPDGTEVKVRDIADVKDAFEQTPWEASFNGKSAVMLDVFRVGDQKPLDVSAAVQEYIDGKRADLPAGVSIASWFDMAELYEGRRDLMVRNALIGLVLVMLILGLFLELRLAFWVTLGIPVSFVGALLFMPATGASINMISLFAFIVVLGMVVDDAIIVGEAIYRRRQQGMKPIDAALAGLKEVAVPVLFAIATTIVAFAPAMFLPGFMGDFFAIVPIVVILTLCISLFESLFILPAHLAHSKPPSERGIFGWVNRQQQKFSRGLEWFVDKTYIPTLMRATRHRYVTVAAALGLFIATIGLVVGGRVGFVFFPKVEGDMVVASLSLPYGTSADDTRVIRDRIIATAQQTARELGVPEDDVRGIFSQLGAATVVQNGMVGGATRGSHLTEVAVYLVAVDERPFTTTEFVQRWRANLGEVAGVESMRFQYDTAGSSDMPIHLDLSHPDPIALRAASAELADRISGYQGVFDVDDGFARGKEQLDFTLKPAAKRSGITELALARQVRAKFYGSEAARVQRGRDEVRVYVRYPESRRESEFDVETLLIRTASGGEVPLGSVAHVERSFADPQISHRNGRQIASVTADVDEATGNANDVMRDVLATHVPALQKRYPGLRYELGGETQTQQETMSALGNGMVIALIVIFALLAIVFRSYIQPIVVMSAIPFGMIGAVFGHIVMGFDMSIMSMIGVVALSGVVINDSLVLIDAINRYRRLGFSVMDAVELGGRRRFRPVLLTSLTTFCGLAPMLLETSVQARFLVPMAVSLAFGVLVSTALLLVLVPALYLIVDDAARAIAKLRAALGRPARPREAEPVAYAPPSDALGATAELARERLPS